MADIPKAFVTGHPVSHSLSPRVHHYWLGLYHLAGSYEVVDTSMETFPAFIYSLAQQGYRGGNVTLPHKERAFALVEKYDDVAAQVGAVNTLWLEKGMLCGGNTDAYGFASNLDDHAPGWVGETALVLGAGGASRAILSALEKRGYGEIVLFNRTRAKAEYLADRFGAKITVADWLSVNDHIGRADLIVNTTSLGMTGHNSGYGEDSSHMAVDFTRANPGAVVTDIVYTPLVTPFLSQAMQAGLKTVDGLGMLLHQAVPGFERWFGVRPEVTGQLRSSILAGISEGRS